MGYGISTNMVFGVLLSPEESAKLHEAISKSFRDADDADEDDEGQDLYGWLEEKELVLIAEDSDSRIHNTQYEPGFEHCFGILIADKGYGSSMSAAEFKAASAGDHGHLAERFKELCQPLLDEAGVTAEPGTQVASYMA